LNIKQGKKANTNPGRQADYIDERKDFMTQEIAEGGFKTMFKHLAVVSYHKIKFLTEKTAYFKSSS